MALTPTFLFKGTGIVPLYAFGVERRSIALPANVSYPAGAVLGELIGASQVTLVTLGTQSSGTFTLTYGGQTTGTIAYGALASAVQTALAALSSLGQAAVHTLTLGGSPTGGTFTISYGGQTTSDLSYAATAAQVQAALLALESVGAGNLTVAGSAGGPYTVTFAGILIGVPQLAGAFEANLTNLIGGTPTFTDVAIDPGGESGINTTVTGSAGGPYTVTFQNADVDAPETLTGSGAALTTPGNFGITTVTAGSVGTQGTYKAYVNGATDGSGVPKLILEFDCQTDSAGLIYFSESGAGPVYGVGLGRLTVPAFARGSFRSQQVSGLDTAGLAAAGWRIVQGTLESGELLLP